MPNCQTIIRGHQFIYFIYSFIMHKNTCNVIRVKAKNAVKMKIRVQPQIPKELLNGIHIVHPHTVHNRGTDTEAQIKPRQEHKLGLGLDRNC